jgi:hypothetical protein
MLQEAYSAFSEGFNHGVEILSLPEHMLVLKGEGSGNTSCFVEDLRLS